MKLSDIKGERTLEVVADLVEPIANIAQDKETAALFKKRQVPKGKTPTQFFIDRVRKSVPSLLRNHKNDMIQILATIEGTDVKDYTENLNMAKLVNDLIELFNDEEFASFLS
jgi:hypothetical protein